MAKVDLATVKAHLRVTDSAEDALIGAYLAAAYKAIEGQLFRKVYETGATIPVADTTGIFTNETINSAALLIVGHLFANREAVTLGTGLATLPMGVDYLLTPDVNYAGGVA